MNELRIFENPQFGEVRTLEEGGQVLFCGKDVCTALGYKDTTNAMKQHCHGVVKRHLTDSLGREQETNFIPEGDIYRLAARSELPGAAAFESWIFDDVLPSIRRNGLYATEKTTAQLLEDPDFLIQTLQTLKGSGSSAATWRNAPGFWSSGCLSMSRRRGMWMKF